MPKNLNSDKSSMMPLVLAVNAGSSSLKLSILRGDQHVANFTAEQLGTDQASVHFCVHGKDCGTTHDSNMDHEAALRQFLTFLREQHDDLLQDLVAVGHRVVHGGESFQHSAIVDDDVLRKIDNLSALAPLHNPHNLNGIKILQQQIPNVPAVAVFDTTFHSTLPPHAFTYPLPPAYREAGIRKYGFHGTSVRFVVDKAHSVLRQQRRLKHHDDYNMIVCHLGSGASVTAVAAGASVETSMGFSPLAGLMMGTRAGSVDPSIVAHAVHHLHKSVDDVLTDFNKNSGLKAMVPAGQSYDMRALLNAEQDQDEHAKLAVQMFVYRIAQHIASSLVALPGPVDAIVFTAGIGEHSPQIRQRTMAALQYVLPVELDEHRNANDGRQSNGILTKDGSWPLVLDVATDEEIEIAHECLKLVQDDEQLSADTRKRIKNQINKTIGTNK